MTVPWPTTAGVRWYGVPVREIKNGKHGHGQELTASPMKVISAFGMGSRGLVDGGGAMERHAARTGLRGRAAPARDVIVDALALGVEVLARHHRQPRQRLRVDAGRSGRRLGHERRGKRGQRDGGKDDSHRLLLSARTAALAQKMSKLR